MRFRSEIGRPKLIKTMKRTKQQSRQRIHLRVRKKISGTQGRPRLSVFRSNKSIYCQIIDDLSGHTLAAEQLKRLRDPR